MASEQRFLGELLVAARRRARGQARVALRRPARARGRPARSRRSTRRRRRDGRRARPRRRGAAPARRAHRPGGHPDGARHPRAHRVREDAQDPRRARGRGARSTSSAATRSTRRRSTTCASSSSKPVEASVGGRDRIEDAINRVYERQAGAEQLESDDESVGGRGRERHPRLRRGGARHPLGQLALLAGDEGARERHPHRAGGEGGPRPLPHRRRALRRAPRAARRS